MLWTVWFVIKDKYIVVMYIWLLTYMDIVPLLLGHVVPDLSTFVVVGIVEHVYSQDLCIVVCEIHSCRWRTILWFGLVCHYYCRLGTLGQAHHLVETFAGLIFNSILYDRSCPTRGLRVPAAPGTSFQCVGRWCDILTWFKQWTAVMGPCAGRPPVPG